MSTSSRSFKQTKQKGSLAIQIRDHMRQRILTQEWTPGAKLPSEFELASEYKAARVTIRTALRSLEAQGLVDIRHGSGSYIANLDHGIRAGLQELRSISTTIQEMGFTPGIIIRASEFRLPTKEEARDLRITEDENVYYMERAYTADGKVVAFSYDTVNITGLSPALMKKFAKVPIFKVLDSVGKHPVRAMTEIHALKSDLIGWGASRPKSGLYLQLKQTHFLRDGSPIMTGSTYFVEGRFQFMIHRTV
ncbi:MAG: GntR family transcriptional regulator [Actinobacteria bacterium]|jgi:GntR family transcriptional regulator|nr:GntR family transcriptional regulator [Actinomycetota bacterium]